MKHTNNKDFTEAAKELAILSDKEKNKDKDGGL